MSDIEKIELLLASSMLSFAIAMVFVYYTQAVL